MKPHEHIILEVARERERQIDVEGWTPEHDDHHTGGELAAASSCYALHASGIDGLYQNEPPVYWPWEVCWWKPTTSRRDLIKATALIIAEIERLDRAAASNAAPAPNDAVTANSDRHDACEPAEGGDRG